MKRVLCVILSIFFIVSELLSIDFKSNSILSSGRWVKIRVAESGVYELTYDELRRYGFSNPEKVKVYGRGGNVAEENFMLPRMDDLEQTPVMHKNNKIYFYTKGVSADSISFKEDGSIAFYPRPNPYSRYGALFLNEDTAEQPLLIENITNTNVPLVSQQNSGYGIWVEEKEKYNPGTTGQTFLGDNFVATGGVNYTVDMPGFRPVDEVFVNQRLALVADADMTSSILLGKQAVTEITGNLLKKNSTRNYLEYGLMTPSFRVDAQGLEVTDNKALLEMEVETTGTLSKAWVDYISVVFPSFYILPADRPQIRHYAKLSDATGLIFSDLPKDAMVWMVDEYGAPTEKPYPVKNCQYAEYEAEGGSANVISLGVNKKWVELITFDPAREQLKPEFEGEVANQNLHAVSVPNMLIITNSILFEQAERLARYHRENDSMDVLVVNQNQIFNEFSGGIRDAMAYRLFCKMLHDRDPQKFQYLLLFGQGTYDNRMLYVSEVSEQLLTYQSQSSNMQTTSYSSDDFFSFIDDGTLIYTQRKMQIAVGRIPLSTAADAEIYLDKLIRYMSGVDNQPAKWRNNVMVIGEDGDDDIHVEQCEFFTEYLNESGNYDVNINKLYFPAYDDETVRDVFVDYLNQGVNFGLYIGHGTYASLTKDQIITNMDKGIETKYKHLPIIYFSSCDVARYDNGSSNIVSKMFTNPNGGLISAIASTRVVYTNLNGKMTNSFGRSLGKTPDYYGGVKTLGKVLVDAKNNAFETTFNKMKFHVIGDPAMKLELPRNLVKLNQIEDTSLSGGDSVSVQTGQKVMVSGIVCSESGERDEQATGKVVLQLYDNERYYVTARKTDEQNERNYVDMYCRGPLLGEVSANVRGGEFSCTMTIPPFVEAAEGEVLPIRMVFENADGQIYSGANRQMIIDRSGEIKSVDITAPSIVSLYVDDSETFVDGMKVSPNSTVYAELYDAGGLNSSNGRGVTGVSIALDNGKKSQIIYDYTPIGEDGAKVSIPLYGLEPGLHVAELLVTDLAGNATRKALTFCVVEENNVLLVTDCSASYYGIRFDIESDKEFDSARLYIKNQQNGILYHSTMTSFPYEWNFVDDSGEKLPAGDYDAYAVVDGVGTPIKKIVILK